MDDKSIPSIPTLYNGIQFRSRLEATWAAFFDLIGWSGLWEYEPIDFNGYIPDFVLKFKEPLFVEIKPALTVSELVPAVNKALESGCPNILALMAFPAPSSCWNMYADIGKIYDSGSCSDDLAVLIACNSCGMNTPISHYGSWACRVCGKGGGDHHMDHLPFSVIFDYWATAKNITQWKGKR